VKKIDLNEIKKIKEKDGTDIYLCGRGQFAGWLLDNQNIDILRLKLNPLVLGEVKKKFGNFSKNHFLKNFRVL
jgi:dihydrofolate reductase